MAKNYYNVLQHLIHSLIYASSIIQNVLFLNICWSIYTFITTETNPTSLFCKLLHPAIWRAHWWCCLFKVCPFLFCSCSFLTFSRLSSAGASGVFHPLPHRLWLLSPPSLCWGSTCRLYLCCPVHQSRLLQHTHWKTVLLHSQVPCTFFHSPDIIFLQAKYCLLLTFECPFSSNSLLVSEQPAY